jgi:subtilisin family serine protease
MVNQQEFMIFKHLYSLLFLSLFFSNSLLSQGYGFKKLLKESPNAQTTFCIENSQKNIDLLEKEGVIIKYSSMNWLFVTTTPEWISTKMDNGQLSSFHFEFAPPSLLNDTARGHHFVDSVHLGVGGLSQGYTGKNVIIGVVDTGIDYQHPDFQDTNGNTRVIRYWDHSINGANPPMPYNYGQEWDSTDINNGTITSIDVTAHGSTVAGCAAGNGLANGTNKGMAPDANIVVVQTNFNLPNWTLTVADACDYIFKVADEYKMPAVVNLSLGTYLGSHDGNDPASEYMEDLIEAQTGRIIVGAAGNSGTWGKYHCKGNVTSDTTFTWLLNNPNNQLGPNKIYFDFWTDTATANTIDFAFGADKPGPTFGFRGHSTFHNAMGILGTVPVYDTIFNPNGVQIATIETYSEIEGPNFHMEVLFENVDSTTYRYRFMTKGTGTYDIWSGTTIGLNEIVSTGLPTIAQMPTIVHYQMPDAEQTVVSSWNCSEKMISVGNARNRANHIDNNGNLYVPFPSSVGQLSPNSSKGPTRAGVTKPDITASGDVSLSAGPLALLNNPAQWNVVDSGGWHVRNGGTSMASPVVSGIAALYLEKCPFGTAASFKTLLTTSAFTDVFTGPVPNNAYGYGKADALDLLLSTATEPTPTITQNGNVLTASSSINYQWVKDSVDLAGQTNQTLNIFLPNGYYQVYAISTDGCPSYSAPFFGVVGAKELSQTLFRLFPNPNSGSFRIETDENILHVSATDMLGREVEVIRYFKSEFQLKNPAAGAYMLNIETENGNAQLKVTIK